MNAPQSKPASVKVTFIATKNGVNLVLKGKPHSISSEDERYPIVIDMIKKGADENTIDAYLQEELRRIQDAISVLDGDVRINSGVITFKNAPLHNALTDQMLRMLDEGFDLVPMAKFLNNLMQNPSKRAVDELYGFLQKGQLPITPDGYFLAYKAVRADYKDIHSGTFDNSIGQKPSMPRNSVDDNKDRTCSEGLHFCSVEYLKSFAQRDGHVMILKINPRDVVSIPADYHDTKGRCSDYEVISEYDNFDFSSPDTPAFSQSVSAGTMVGGYAVSDDGHGIVRMDHN